MPRRLLAAVLVAVLAVAMTALSTTVEAKRDSACKVRNDDTGRSYDGLRPALAAARSGDTLVVQGTCHGTFIVRVPVRIEGVRGISEALDFDSGVPRIVSRSSRPALIVLPSVDAFEVEGWPRIRGGFGIGRPGAEHLFGLEPWPGLYGPLGRARFDRTCRRWTSRPPVGVTGTTNVSVVGRCWSRRVIDEPTRITSENRLFGRWAGPKGVITKQSGRPALRSRSQPGFVVRAEVDELVIEGLVIRDGLRIGEGVR